MTKRIAIGLSSAFWLLMALLLLLKGYSRLEFSKLSYDYFLCFVGVCFLVLGAIKGKIVLQKIAKKRVQSILASSEPVPFSVPFPPRFLALIFCMMGLGIVIKNLPLPLSYLGFFDFALALALFLGSLPYWQARKLEGEKDVDEETL